MLKDLSDVVEEQLFTVHIYVFVVAGVLVLLTAFVLVTPVLVLVFTCLLGIGAAVQLPTWQSVIPELVPRHQLCAATRLDMVAVNVGRSVGPAIAGIVIALAGVATVFALNGLSVIFLASAAALAPPRTTVTTPWERFAPALGRRPVRMA